MNDIVQGQGIMAQMEAAASTTYTTLTVETLTDSLIEMFSNSVWRSSPTMIYTDWSGLNTRNHLGGIYNPIFKPETKEEAITRVKQLKITL